jgi:1-acyl-sn-glycerol-3-phosphate acyltransferase
MTSRIRHWLRVAAFALGFSAFGLLCLFVTFIVFPLMRLRSGSDEDHQLAAQRIVHRQYQIFLRILGALDIADVTVTGEERLREPGAHLLVANHPTLIDVVVIGSLMPQLDCVAKRAAWSNPFMLGVIKATGYIANDDGVGLIEDAAARLRRGRSLLLFPEGTRSPAQGLQPFQRGAAHLALRTGLSILPVHVRCEPRGVMKGQKWWDVPPSRMRFHVEICEPLHVKEWIEPGEPRARAARRLTAALRDFYVKKLH